MGGESFGLHDNSDMFSDQVYATAGCKDGIEN